MGDAIAAGAGAAGADRIEERPGEVVEVTVRRQQATPPQGWPPLLREEPPADGWDQAFKVEA